jgi:hypothetical protein
MEATEALSVVGKFAAPLVTKPGLTPEDMIKIGSAFAVVAEHIFKAVGGDEMAAHQFYAMADRCAAERPE